VTSGPGATHRIACHNPPTAAEAAAGRPQRPGFVAAPPPGIVVDELARSLEATPATADEVVMMVGDQGPISAAGAAGLPLPPEEGER